jgi:hypothetical protein
MPAPEEAARREADPREAGPREADPLAWSQSQAAQLRRLAGETPTAVDWPGVIAEIDAVGVAELNATRILLRQAMALLLQLRGWPEHADRPLWQIALGGALADLAIRLTSSIGLPPTSEIRPPPTSAIRPLLDLGALYQQARGQFAGVALDGQLPRPFPAACPFTLDDLLHGDRAHLDTLLAPNEDL